MTDSDEDSNIPSSAECDKRCQEFAQITGTDSALAMFYLQDRDWSVERSLNSYFEEAGASKNGFIASAPAVTGLSFGSSSTADNTNSTSGNTNNSSSQNAKTEEDSEADDPKIRLISWNIDGLDQKSLRSRTLGVVDKINNEKPHVVFLQEVVEESESILKDKCPTYQFVSGCDDSDYYTAIMVKVGQVKLDGDKKIIEFPNTSMMRNLLMLKCTIKRTKFTFMTSHLESTKNYGEARKVQLKKAFDTMSKCDGDRTVVFGGDLNLRDAEVQQIGGVPENMYDLWEITGKRPEAKFTWDTYRNDNLNAEGAGPKFKVKCRFDRLYLRNSAPKKIKTEYFELIGIERLKSCQRFCSDHWGLLAHFKVI